MPVRVDQELDRAGVHVAHGARQRPRRASPMRCAQLGGRRRARASPRSPSGGGAGWSTRARRGGPRCRGCRPGPGSRCGAAARWPSRGRRCRRRRRSGPRCGPGARADVELVGPGRTRRMPLPPPPAAALSMTGKPMRLGLVADRSRGRSRARGCPGTTGTPAATATRRAEVFSPMSAMASAARADEDDARCPRRRRAKSAFSARKP